MAMVGAASMSSTVATAKPASIGKARSATSKKVNGKEISSALPACHAQVAQELLGSCVVKNTFVELKPETTEQAGLIRQSSEPALFLSTKEFLDGSSACSEKDKAVATTVQGPSAAADEEASTDDTGAGSEAEEDSSSTTSTGEEVVSGAGDEGTDSSQKPHCQLLMRALASARHVLASVDPEEVGECATASSTQAECLLDFLCSRPAPAPAPAPAPSSRLRSVAPPWTPKGEPTPVQSAPPGPYTPKGESLPGQSTVRSPYTPKGESTPAQSTVDDPYTPVDEFAALTKHIASRVLAHVKSLPITCNAYLFGSSRGWTIRAFVRAEDLPDVSCLISNAKAALVHVTRCQAGVHLLASCAEPFTDRPNAFSARLALMKNQDMACWDCYASGRCRRARCRWEHPVRVDYLWFSVLPTEETNY